jgi:hypothetical protein
MSFPKVGDKVIVKRKIEGVVDTNLFSIDNYVGKEGIVVQTEREDWFIEKQRVLDVKIKFSNGADLWGCSRCIEIVDCSLDPKKKVYLKVDQNF